MLEAQPAPVGLIKDSSDQEFMADVIDASQDVPVIVDFWAPWCGPCKQLGPILEKVVNGAGGKVKLVKVDIDQEGALASRYGVTAVPTLKIFEGGIEAHSVVGLPRPQDLVAQVEKVAGSIGSSR